MAERQMPGGADERRPEVTDARRPEPERPDLPPDLDQSAPDDFGATDPADLDQVTLGDSGGLDAGLDTDLVDRSERMGDLGTRDPIGEMDMPTEIPGAPAAGSPEEARDAGRGAAGSETEGMSTGDPPTPEPVPYPDTSENPSSSGEKVTLDSSPADGGVPSSNGDEAGSLKGLVKPAGADGAFKMGTSTVKFQGKQAERMTDVLDHNKDGGDAPSGAHVAPAQMKVIVGNPGGPEGQEGGPPTPIPGGWDPDDVVDGSDNDLQGDGGYTDPADDPVGAQMEGGPVVDDSIRYTVDPDAVPRDPSMLPETLSGEGGDIDPVEF